MYLVLAISTLRLDTYLKWINFHTDYIWLILPFLRNIMRVKCNKIYLPRILIRAKYFQNHYLQNLIRVKNYEKHLSHPNHYHRRPVPRVLIISSNFHHYFISTNEANPEKFSFKNFSYQFLLIFKNFKVSLNSWRFMKLGF